MAKNSTPKKSASKSPKVKAKTTKPTTKKTIKKKSVTRMKTETTGTKSAAKTTKKHGYSKTELDYFRTIIVEKKKEILEELETLRDTMMDSTTGEYTSENPTYSTHMEQGTDTMEREKTFLFAAREGKFLNYLEDALKRIDTGNYGLCSTCGKLIEKERLEAVPHASQCLDCKLKRGK